MPMTWTDQADAKLLIGILHLSTQKVDYEALAEWMGPGVLIPPTHPTLFKEANHVVLW
ncbi:uncharacterized protein EURHEDRAFT_414094 [Aspergillus ruber CBS 135680]|uniref:Uncharacterized protein n=1 Tax=Aspergillus ruber (strain CBS 135680) TaxID=1388766 RepID=A0A017SBU7_ASPRC|nr:uncharacterized protein EURHEDRAFT_414094 [Aspergillus ruber CBS 135680]EYE93680.1 hypothetical protein EURHEDRAFT_414094 [Aspergillus ruber CBS 135680]